MSRKVSKAEVQKLRQEQLERIRDRSKAIDAIADKAVRDLTEPTQAWLDDHWQEPEVWSPDGFGAAPAQAPDTSEKFIGEWLPVEQQIGRRKIADKAERDYRGSRANEDKAAVLRRAVRRVLSELRQQGVTTNNKSDLARRIHRAGYLPGDPGERTLRRLVAEILTNR
ncbi:MAG TPA: hypothetical protein VLV25_12950 [Steroidobacteraceae bacterium]|nr:hypothetical protein [Steroidobacteraceae bacterium]